MKRLCSRIITFLRVEPLGPERTGQPHMPGPVFIDGDDIELRTIEEEDIEFLQEGINYPAVRQYAGGDLPYNRHRYKKERFDSISGGEFVQLLVCDGDERLGNVSLAPIDGGDYERGWSSRGYRFTSCSLSLHFSSSPIGGR